MTRQEKERFRKELREEQKYKLNMRRELAAANAAFSGGNLDGEGEEMDEDEGEEEEEPDEYDVDGVLGGDVWNEEEEEDDDEPGGGLGFGGGPQPPPPPSGGVQQAIQV
jgi:hypothetical protein